ncbi:MAG: aldo/keto reductase [Clostridiales bacterium]|nr:aldo/keto reductase [Clostridiales bacterium]
MEYVPFGNTGMTVSRVGFGGIPIQRIDAEGTKKLFEKLVECGVNYIDTARGYTVSEEYIGFAIDSLGIRDKLYLATKSMAATKDAMAKDIETSLKNLRTDHIDLYQIHNPSMEKLDTILAPGGALEALYEAKEAGKILHLGLTCHSAKVFERALGLDFVESIMFPYNIVETQGRELVEKCRECGKAFIAMKPLAGGAIEDGRSAMRYLLTDPGVTVVIPGMYLESEIEENTSFGSSPLTDDEKERIAAIRKSLTGNFCRRCNYCAPCTVGINIPSVFLFEGYLERYGLEDWARGRYASLPVKASACVKCGACETRCPYELPIRQMLERAAKAFGE